MATSFDIKLTGEPRPGRSRESAAQALAALMRLSESQALGLLAGRETVIKRGLAEDQVPRYLKAMEQAGVMVRHEPSAGPTPVTAAPPPRPAPVTPAAAAPLTLTPLDTVPAAMARLASTPAAPAAEPTADVECPACGAKQPKRTLCRECGADMPRMRAAQEEARRQPAADSPFAPPQANVRDVAAVAAETETPGPLSISFAGRIGRLRYLAYTLPAYLPLIVGAFLGGIIGGATRSGTGFAILAGIGGVATLAMAIRIMVLRLHDLNISGKWMLLPVAVGGLAAIGKTPVIGIMGIAVVVIGSLVLTFKGGTAEDNDFGPPPGPNSGWVTLGAIVVIVFSVISGFSKPANFGAAPPLPAATQADD